MLKKIGKKFNFLIIELKKIPKISNLKSVNWKEIDILFTALPTGKSQILAKTLKNKKSKNN